MNEEPADIFNTLLRNEAKRFVTDSLAEKNLGSLNDHLSPEEMLELKQWLSGKSTGNFLSESMKPGPRMDLGVVTKVAILPNGNADVTYCNDSGKVMVFAYSKKIYPEAPDGYHVGDILVIRFSQPGWVPDSVTPIRCDQEDYLSILKRISKSRK